MSGSLFTDDIMTEQVWDRAKMGALWKQRDSLDPGVASKLDALYKSRNKGVIKGSTRVKYSLRKFAGKLGFGRLYGTNESLETFENEIRGTLCSELYYDIDVVNCHPTLMHQFAKRYFDFEMPHCKSFCENRDEYYAQLSKNREVAKTELFKVLYGGSVSLDSLAPYHQECKMLTNQLKGHANYEKLWKAIQKNEQSNQSGKLLSYVLQTEERRVMLALRNYLLSEGWSVDVLSYDGCMIRKKSSGDFPDTLLSGASEAIVQNTGYRVALTNKPMMSLDLPPQETPEESTIYPFDFLLNDSFGAKVFSTLAGDLLCQSTQKLHVFDTENGLWTDDIISIKKLVHRFKDQLVFKKYGVIGITVVDYGGTETKITPMLTQTLNYVKNKVFDYDTSKGKLLFADGIYDFDTGQFTEGFNPEIHFAGRIDRPFPQDRDLSYEAFVNTKLFEDPYLADQTEQAQFFKTALARALYGDYLAKRAYISVGEPNCGRGLLTLSLRQAFGSFVSTFSSNNLLYNAKSSDDEAKKLAWFVPISNSRIAISNEISMSGKFVDSNTLKALSSGGDQLNARKLHENESPLISRTTCFLLTNDIPDMKPADKGLLNRLCVNELKKSYVAYPDPTDPTQAQEDRTLPIEAVKEPWANALFWLLADSWAEFATTDRVAPKPESVRLAVEEWVEKGVSIKSLLEEHYDITKSENDWVRSSDVRTYLKTKGCKDSDTKMGREIRKLTGISKANKKIDGKAICGYFGLKDKEED